MKRNLILTFLACGASVALCGAAKGQTPATSATASEVTEGPGGNHPHGGGILQRLTSELDLSGTQQAAIAPLLEAAKPQMKAIHDEAKQKRDALIDSVSAQITPLLTPDQQAKFSGLVTKFKNGPGPGGPGLAHRGAPGRAGGPGGDRLQRLTRELGLTPEEQTQIKPILEAAQTQVKAAFADASLTPQQKFAKVKDTFEAANAQINGILSPAQQTQFAALKEKMRRRLHGPGEAPASPSVTGTTSA